MKFYNRVLSHGGCTSVGNSWLAPEDSLSLTRLSSRKHKARRIVGTAHVSWVSGKSCAVLQELSARISSGSGKRIGVNAQADVMWWIDSSFESRCTEMCLLVQIWCGLTYYSRKIQLRPLHTKLTRTRMRKLRRNVLRFPLDTTVDWKANDVETHTV